MTQIYVGASYLNTLMSLPVRVPNLLPGGPGFK